MSLMTSPAAISQFALAGNARLTLSSLTTGARFTYRIRASDDGKVHFVSLLTGQDNENSYSYMGIVRDGAFMLTAKSRVTEAAPAVKAFSFFWRHVVQAGVM